MVKESKLYSQFGASSSKTAVKNSISVDHSYFVQLCKDPVNPELSFSLHSDGAGTKSLAAYLAYKESGDLRYFKNLAKDSLYMNLDDLICVGKPVDLYLNNTINRNFKLIPDEAIKEVIDGYVEEINLLKEFGIKITNLGGETADVGDCVRTLIVDSTLFARFNTKELISTDNISSGDIIVGLSSFGKSTYEDSYNSGIGSNGLSLARHALIARKYAEKYPEILDPNIENAYQGKYDLFETPKNYKQTIADALLSPTRTYSPLLIQVINELKSDIHGIIHCTGGGQRKIANFGKGKRYIKDNLFPFPDVFKLIQESMNIDKEEMYSVFNMGHRIEIVCKENCYEIISEISNYFDIEARRVGYVEDSKENEVII